MDVDLIIKNANLSNDQTGVDIACKDGVIISIERGINANAKKNNRCTGPSSFTSFCGPSFSYGCNFIFRYAADECFRHFIRRNFFME